MEEKKDNFKKLFILPESESDICGPVGLRAILDSICELFHMYYDEAIRIVEECKDFPTFQNYIGKIFKGRQDFHTPFEIEEKKDLFSMLEVSQMKHSEHQSFVESLPA